MFTCWHVSAFEAQPGHVPLLRRSDKVHVEGGASSASTDSVPAQYLRVSSTPTLNYGVGMVLEAHLSLGADFSQIVYLHASVNATPTQAPPNGNLHIEYTGIRPADGSKWMRGFIDASASSLQWAEKSVWGSTPLTARLHMSYGANGDSSGIVQRTSSSTRTYSLGSNSAAFCRQQLPTSSYSEQCMDRTQTSYSTWSYGLCMQSILAHTHV